MLEAPIFYSVCLLSSSLTIHLAVKALRKGKKQEISERGGAATILLGAIFLFGTASEWHRLIYQDGLTISTNLFGTTYYSLVGLHGFHVVVGLIAASPRHGIRAFGQGDSNSTLERLMCCLSIGTSWTQSGWWYSQSFT